MTSNLFGSGSLVIAGWLRTPDDFAEAAAAAAASAIDDEDNG